MTLCLKNDLFCFSGPSPAIAGGDAVDYGAYTGGYGAFGWYSDHPNHDGIGHRRR